MYHYYSLQCHMSLQKSSLKKHLILLMLKTVLLLNVFNWIQYMSDTFSIFILLNKNFKRTKIFCDIIKVFTVTFDQCNASLLKTLLTSNFGTVVCCVLWDYNMYCRSKVMGCCDNAWQTGWKGKDSYEWQTPVCKRGLQDSFWPTAVIFISNPFFQSTHQLLGKAKRWRSVPPLDTLNQTAINEMWHIIFTQCYAYTSLTPSVYILLSLFMTFPPNHFLNKYLPISHCQKLMFFPLDHKKDIHTSNTCTRWMRGVVLYYWTQELVWERAKPWLLKENSVFILNYAVPDICTFE